MALTKNTVCKKCGKKFKWKIERPGDGFWDRWRNDNGNTLSNWFVTNYFCWDHAFETIPPEFFDKINTIEYLEEE
ncbi:MAG: hypothetical protein O3A55_05835 [Bacteroidetes bacterium]|nr:hypothetical protein [Bacteroidota bacterium]